MYIKIARENIIPGKVLSNDELIREIHQKICVNKLSDIILEN